MQFAPGELDAKGFRSLGDFLAAVRRTTVGETRDERLERVPRGANETDPTAGGFTVPEAYAAPVIGSIYEEATLAPLCDLTETAGPLTSIKQPAFDETGRADGSRWGGTLAYWAAEADQVTPTKPKFRSLEFEPRKLIIVAYVTEELFSDVNLLEAHFRRAMSAEGSFALDQAIYAGEGGGKPLGILKSPCLITVDKETGQAANTIVRDNVRKMWSRLPLACRKRAVWLVSEDAEEQIEQFEAPLYYPQGAAGNPWPLLKGRPVFAVEQASMLGTAGDIVLADLSQYQIVQGPPRFALSADVAFLTDEMAFRFTLRVDGMPVHTSPITPFKNTNTTRSPFVTLGSRT